MLAFSPISSRHAKQKSLPPETENISSENSCTRWAGETDFGSLSILACFTWLFCRQADELSRLASLLDPTVAGPEDGQ